MAVRYFHLGCGTARTCWLGRLRTGKGSLRWTTKTSSNAQFRITVRTVMGPKYLSSPATFTHVQVHQAYLNATRSRRCGLAWPARSPPNCVRRHYRREQTGESIPPSTTIRQYRKGSTIRTNPNGQMNLRKHVNCVDEGSEGCKIAYSAS